MRSTLLPLRLLSLPTPSRCATMLVMARLLDRSLLLASATLPAQTIIRLGTLVPKGSRWHEILLNMGEEWKKASGGKVELKIYPGGEQGDEPEMVQKVRIHEAASGGDFGRRSKRNRRGGFGAANPHDAGFLGRAGLRSGSNFRASGKRAWPSAASSCSIGATPARCIFSPRNRFPIPTKSASCDCACCRATTPRSSCIKPNGFHPVALAATDILTGLQTGLIEAFQSPPLIALSNQWFGGAKNMLDISFAQLVGATLIDKGVWDKIPAPVQKEMLASARTAGVALRDEIRKAEAGAVPIMQQFGLNVVHPDAKTVAEWRQLTESIWPKFRGTVVPRRSVRSK